MVSSRGIQGLRVRVIAGETVATVGDEPEGSLLLNHRLVIRLDGTN